MARQSLTHRPCSQLEQICNDDINERIRELKDMYKERPLQGQVEIPFNNSLLSE